MRIAGGLPINGKFTSSGGTLIIWFSGTARHASQRRMMLDMYIDNVLKASSTLLANLSNTHMTFPSRAKVVTGIAAGDHTLQLKTSDMYEPDQVKTDQYDFFHAIVMEFPF